MDSELRAQAAYVPRVEGEIVKAPILVCGGMGGSALPALALRFLGATPYVVSHRDYGVPAKALPGASYVAISYSGETEETLSFANEALERGLPLSVIATGGRLLALAKERGLPHVEVPNGPVPREALVSLTKALLALIGEEDLLPADALSRADLAGAEQDGKALGSALVGRVPLFYSSVRNEALAYFGKIACNETAKAPAFFHLLPELDHNELQGFGGGNAPALTAVFLLDEGDHDRVRLRMDVTGSIIAEHGAQVREAMLRGQSRAEAFLHGFWMLRTAAHALAESYGVDPDATPLVDALKRAL